MITSNYNATVKHTVALVDFADELQMFTSVKVCSYYCRVKMEPVSTGILIKMAKVSMIFTPSKIN